jgi:predicted RNA binding protein YcfA (HicA-like mRNA interferase family)
MPPRLPRTTADEVLRALHRDGWFESRQSGSHVILRHPAKAGRITVPRHVRKTLKLATIASIIQQAGLTRDEFVRLL